MHHPEAARRRRRAAVLGAPPDSAGPPARPGAHAGTVLDASPHLLVLAVPGGEVRLPLSDTTAIWHGDRAGPDVLRPGRRAVARPYRGRPGTERVWIDAARVTGTITAATRRSVDVDLGPHRGTTTVTIPETVYDRIRVRHPRLEPGYLFDTVCVRTPDGPRAVAPGTSQPGYRADALTAPEPDASVPGESHGTATWFDGGDAPGAAYPAVDPEGRAGGCADAPRGCVPLPLLSIGSGLTVHNACTGRTARIPVTECGCVAARFCDRCVQCGTSPRGRLVELTPVAFAALGGDLETGCFNAVLRHDRGTRRW
ncbi:hypothetical protein [Actinomadura rayongensis]|uniref:Uncharacterized protein n=1 Tax=Actinomadura rayongensis TaxID=1429076 RepID=A0A6I4W543_9ACTN|nr:hypothetical protein [Actinomadura rayongensis]MXQ65307.1 hypothetical protein [Actinomadura rayongensis]